MTRRGCAGSTTFLLGSAANADAQNVNASTTLAHRTDAPHRRLNLFSILITVIVIPFRILGKLI